MNRQERFLQLHGGDRYRLDIRLDFSVNTNPLGMPDYVRRTVQASFCQSEDRYCEWYPDPECSRLRKALASYHHISGEAILCGNGACELIYALVRALAASGARAVRAVLPLPSFGEYERALAAVGADVTCYLLEEAHGFAWNETILETLTPDTDLLFLCNPNNPTGNRIPETLLEHILRHCREREIVVLLDECFLELAVQEEKENVEAEGYEDFGEPNIDRKQQCRLVRITEEYPNTVVLKAFTKWYAMPGLRLGYCISGNGLLLARMREQIPCWSVSGIAQLAGMTALDNAEHIDYIGQSTQLIRVERAFLKSGLEKLGMHVIPGCASFLCFSVKSCEDSFHDLYERLLDVGILIRDCRSFRGIGDGWYRIAVRPHEENVCLLRELEKMKGTV